MILFNLLLSTALLIATPDASGEYKKVQIPPTTHHAVKLAKKQSTVKPVEKPEPNTLAFDGVKLHVGELVAGNLFVDRGPNLQNYINQGFIGQAWHALNNNDGLVTYMAGHNPGVMSPLAAYVAVGKSVQVTDAQGSSREYIFTDVLETPMNIHQNGVNQAVVDYTYYHMDDHEGIVIQFCRPERGIMQLWIASPK